MSLVVDDPVGHGRASISPNKPLEMTSARSPSNEQPPDFHSTSTPKPRRKIPKQSWEYAVRSGTAGGLAACAAKSVVAPLDRVKILFQASNPQFAKYTGSWDGVLQAMRDIYRSNGTRGLFRGHSATLLRIFPYGGIKFLAYEQFRAIIIPSKELETHYRRFIAGAASGCASVLLTYPLEVIRVRLAFETKSNKRVSLRDICQTIYNERPRDAIPRASTLESARTPREAATTIVNTAAAVTPRHGVINFFRGFTPTLWGMIPYAGSSFLTHDAAGDFMRLPSIAPYAILPMTDAELQRLPPNKPRPLRAWAELTTGGIAGLVSQTVSYPLEVIRRRMQVGGVVGDGRRLRMVEVAKQIVRDKGWRGFYVGLGIGYVKVMPLAATSFFVYERLKISFGI